MLHGMEYLPSFSLNLCGKCIGKYSSPMEQHLQYTKTTSAEKVCFPLKTARSCYVRVGLGNLNPRLLGLDQPAGNGHPKLVVKCRGNPILKMGRNIQAKDFLLINFPDSVDGSDWRPTLQGKSPSPYPTIGKGKLYLQECLFDGIC